MELSRGFIAAAEAEAKSTGVQLATSHESCNRLVYHDGEYDLITISQALHWLDDVMVCRGVSRILRDRGSFHVILASLDVDAGHPLAYLLGDDSILGAKAKQPFMAQARALMRRLALLFEALDAPDVERIDPNQRWQTGDDAPPSRVHPVGITHFRQTRPFGPGFARAFLTPTHIVRTGIAPDVFWRDREARCAGASAQALEGHHDWAVLHLARRTPDAAPGPDGAMVEIGWDGPPLG
jgi:hypothetical protein